MNVTGPLVVDPEFGTALIIEDVGNMPFRTVVQWPEGYTARQAGREVAVLDENGSVVAVTGKMYRFEKFDPPGYRDPPGFSACGPPDLLP